LRVHSGTWGDTPSIERSNVRTGEPGGRSPRARPRFRLALVAVGLALLATAPAARAQASASASISDSVVEPGQTVTVRASGLYPGTTSFVDYIPDGVRLATVTAGGDGSYSVQVRIPGNSPDGRKQIVVTALDAAGHYAYLPSNLSVNGPAASARLSDTTLTPSQAFQLSGSRFRAGYKVYAVLYPEQVYLGAFTAGDGGSFTANLRMPKDLLNGKHGFVVAGPDAKGGTAYLQLTASVTGGIGSSGVDPFAKATPGAVEAIASTTTVDITTTTTIETPFTTDKSGRPPLGPHGTDTKLVLTVLLVLALGTVGALVASWLRSPGGRRWRRERAEARRRASPP
jgi:hypothetical protein